ncbi:hypothetical protein [Rhodococcus sp. AG1013]|uniref:hypothetical protein n=1 Tax=Rhodococcus sp. AG1013 TaxID=2183996 RepID=UPI000E0B4711|nr:hypothetical protein [Rhodococcus sp. AG1013]
MVLWIVEYVAGEPGCPPILKGKLNRPWYWDAFDPEPAESPTESDYELVTTNRRIDVDYWGVNWLASEEFVRICRGFGLRLVSVPVRVLQSGGVPTTKRYSYLRWGEWASVIDVAASDVELEFEFDTAGGKAPRNRNIPDAPRFESVARFEIAEARVPEAAAFICTDVGHELVCTDEFKRACEAAGLRGLGFSPLSDYTKADFWG